MEYSSSRTGDTIPNYLTTSPTLSNGSFVSLAFHKACCCGTPIRGIDITNWHRSRPNNTEPVWTLTKYLSTDIGPDPTILSHHCSSLTWRRNQSQPTWAPAGYIQQALGIPRFLSGTEHLSRQTSRLLSNLLIDAVANRFIFCQLTYVTPSNIANQRQDFWTRCRGSSGSVQNIGSYTAST